MGKKDGNLLVALMLRALLLPLPDLYFFLDPLPSKDDNQINNQYNLYCDQSKQTLAIK